MLSAGQPFIDDPEKMSIYLCKAVWSTYFKVCSRTGGDETGDAPGYGVEGTMQGGIEAGAQIVSVLVDIPYQYGETFGVSATAALNWMG